MDPVAAFEALYESTYADLVRFVQRRTDRAHAEDVVADTFVVVWRRFGDLPADPDQARAWVFGTARHILLNTERSGHRRRALGAHLADVTLAAPAGALAEEADLAATRVDLARAWSRLSERHQEALALSVLDGLDAPRAAQVLGVSPVAFRLRLSRARRALRAHLHLTPTTTPNPTPDPAKDACDVS